MAESKGEPVYCALLRGINVGGKNKLPMAELAKLFSESGCRDVRTYIASGNVVFRMSAAKAGKLPALIARRIEESFGLKVPVVVRSAAELAEVVGSNPYLQAGLAETNLHVMFLADAPGAEKVALLDPDRSPGDQFAVRGREIYLHLPNGVADCKITNAWLDSRLKTVSTGRNWRTVLKLYEMTRE